MIADGLFLVLAQTPAPPTAPADFISGASGWTACGILVLVLSWLFFRYLPAKDQQLKELLVMFAAEREADRQARKVQSDHSKATLDRVCQEFKEDMQAERTSCDRRNDMIVKAIESMSNRIKP